MPSLLVIAGEMSGDMHAAHVVAALKRRVPGLVCYGIGGDRLRAEGVELFHDTHEMAVMGFYEVMKRYGFFRRVFGEMVALAKERRPDAVLLVDYPGFNLRFAAEMKKAGIKVIYYVCPQVWAWHRSRIGRMARILDRLLVIFPFEVDVFQGTGLRTDYVGHPLVDDVVRALEKPAHAFPNLGKPVVALLPGSRRQELERILPVMAEAAALLAQNRPGCSFLLAAASPELAELARALVDSVPGAAELIRIETGHTRDIVRQARAALVTSGTATLETALLGCPMLVVYRTAPLTYAAGRLLIKVPHIGMVNLIAGRGLCPEFIQHEARGETLAQALLPLLDDTPERTTMLAGLAEVREKLGTGGAADRAADIVTEELASVGGGKHDGK